MDGFRSEQRAVVRFPIAQGDYNMDIYRQMVEVYGERCLGRSAKNNCSKSFRKGQ